MTTIAYRDGIIAADSLMTAGGVISGHTNKIRKYGRVLAGGAGASALIEDFWAWLDGRSKHSTPPLIQDSTVFLVMPDDLIMEWTAGMPVRLRAPFYAIGSGCRFAMGAMQMGATAAQAVHAAAAHDVYTGGKITTLHRDHHG